VGCEKGNKVKPRSLYLQQLGERMGAKAVENVTTAEQREGKIYERIKAELSNIE